jgi:NADPH:quinone reductase-like Zn-dependent oxidoreductase
MSISPPHDPVATATVPASMNAWLQDRYGDPGVVASRRIPVPSPRAGQVLLRLRATALNAGDVRVLRGTPYLVRLFFGVRRPRVPGRGMDVAGTVVASGPGVDWKPGDEVFGQLPGGGLAEYAVAAADRLTRRPATVSPADAATLPVAGGTAWQALEPAGDLAGRRVLVLGASGGVGSFTVQLAAARGAEVWATCGERNRAFVTALGASRVEDYRVTSVADLPAASCDVVVDIAGTARLRDVRRVLRDGGTAVLVAGTGGDVVGPIPRLLAAVALSRRRRRLLPLAASPKGAIHRALAELVERGDVRPAIERTYPLTEAGAALAHVDAGHTRGKIVVVPG